jgi:hypothetical protein
LDGIRAHALPYAGLFHGSAEDDGLDLQGNFHDALTINPFAHGTRAADATFTNAARRLAQRRHEGGLTHPAL